MKYTTQIETNVTQDDYEWDFLTIKTTGTSVDRALAEVETLPEVIEFLKMSTLGLEYIEIEFNHGQDITIKIPRYA